MSKRLQYEKLDPYVFVTKLAGFEHTKHIQGVATHQPEADTDIPMVQGKNIRNGFFVQEHEWFISKDVSDALPRSVLDKPCILIPYVGSNLGEVGIFPNDYRCHLASNIAKVELISEKYILEYLKYYLQSDIGQGYLFQSKQGSAQPNITMESIRNTLIVERSQPEQQKICDVLSAVDQKFLLNQNICAELESMAKTLYDYWFTQFDFPNEEGKPYRSSGGEMVWNDQLKREIPKDWDVVPVTESFDVCYGFPFDTECFVEDPSAQPVVRIRDILEGSISAYTTEKVDKKYWLHSGDMIIGMDGNFHINFWDSKPALLNQRCVRIRSTCEYPVFMAYFSSLPYIKAREKTVSRTTVGHLSADDIKALYVFKPDAATLASVKSIFNAALEKICQVKDENRELTKLRDWLLPMLMNGQATVE